MKFSGSFIFILATKLKALKGFLKSWNKELFGRVERKKSEALCRVCFWDMKEKDNLLTVGETEERRSAREEYKYWSLLEEVLWRQKSRELWLKESDKNMRFLHRMANSHRRRNLIKKVKINGCWFEAETNIRGKWGQPSKIFSQKLMFVVLILQGSVLKILEGKQHQI